MEASGAAGTGMMILWIVVVFGIMYCLMIRPQKIRRIRLRETDRAREARRMGNRPAMRRVQAAQALTVR